MALWAALLCGPLVAGAQPEAAPRQVAPAAIEVFVREGCQHCEQAKAFLARLQRALAFAALLLLGGASLCQAL